MDAHQRTAVEHTQSGVLTALADQRRRTTLSLLGRLDAPGIEELATELAAEEAETLPSQVSPTEVERAQVALEHTILPKLTEENLVAREDGRVTTTSHPALEDPTVAMLVESDADEWDDVLAALADARRCVVLAAVHAADGPTDRSTLAAEVSDLLAGDVSPGAVERELHHMHIPALEAAGLLTFDAEAETVSYDGHPVVAEAWLEPDDAYTRRSFLSMPV